MPKTVHHEALRQLAARIPKRLHRAIRVHCAVADVLIREFIVQAIEEKIARDGGRARRHFRVTSTDSGEEPPPGA